MIINNFVVSYIVMMIISLGICVPAAFVAWFAARTWKACMPCEKQYVLEKKVYLVITLLCLGLSARIFMIPMWFFTLQSLIPLVPGAMCMTGVHLLDTPVSAFATILKFFIPLAIIYWLTLNAADRRIETQPFVKRKLMLVALLAILMLAESFLDMHFLGSIRPRIVSCCTSVFDIPRLVAIKLIRQSGMIWVASFCLSLAIALVSSILRTAAKTAVRAISAFSSLAALVSFVFVLHTKVSPLMLDAPYHQCVFCLWQEFPDIAAASVLLIAGLWISFVCSILPDLKKYREAAVFAEKLKWVSIACCSLGTAWIAARAVLKYFISSSMGA